VVEAEPAPQTDLTLGVLMRDPEGRKAILLRGEEIFTVREGEEIDEGTRVLTIDETSVVIVDADGNEVVLASRCPFSEPRGAS
jgi:nitrite reductase/ring-hydroxylating ferredoxin subunit